MREPVQNSLTAKQEIRALKIKVGRTPFDQHFGGDYFAACCFHVGDSDHSMHLKECDDGAWIATCFSECLRSWDAIDFIKHRDKLSFADAVKKLSNGQFPAASTVQRKPKPPVEPMTDEQWEKWGRPITAGDVERFAKSREGKGRTASLEIFQELGCRVRGDAIGFPCRRSTEQGVIYDCIKVRLMDKKEFWTENSISQNGIFNLDAVSPISDVYVVEGQPDTAVMREAGFCAVSVVRGGQKKFDEGAIQVLCMAPRIFLIGDQSQPGDPGQKCMDTLQSLLPPEKTYRVNFAEAHDVSELAKKLGNQFEDRIKELTNEALRSWVCRNIPTISKLSAEPTKWLVERFIPYGCVTMLTGNMGSMKSLLSMLLSQALSAGKNEFLSRPILHDVDGWNITCTPPLRGKFPRSTPVLYLDRENPQGMVNERSSGAGILANAKFNYWGEWEPEPLPEPDDPRLLEFAAQGGFIVFDSLQDWYPPNFNEIDNAKIVELMRKFRRLARMGAGVLMLHHLNASGERSRGGTAFVGLTDMAIRSTKNTEQGTVELRAERFRLCANWEIDIRCHWDAGERHSLQKHYQVEVLRDQLESDAIAERKEEKAEKNAKRSSKDETDAVSVSQAIRENPENAPRTIADKLRMSPARFERLAELTGLTWDKEPGAWIGLAP